MARRIIPGYKGVLDLDLSEIHPVIHESLINQHKKDIEDYKKYQESIPIHLRYDNTIQKIKDDKIFYDKIRDAKLEKKKKEENIRFQEMLERYI